MFMDWLRFPQVDLSVYCYWLYKLSKRVFAACSMYICSTSIVHVCANLLYRVRNLCSLKSTWILVAAGQEIFASN